MSSPLSPTLSLKTLFFFGASCLGSLRAQQIRAITYIHIYLSHTFHIFLFYLIAPLSLFFGARQCYSPYTTFFVPVRPGTDGSLTPFSLLVWTNTDDALSGSTLQSHIVAAVPWVDDDCEVPTTLSDRYPSACL